MTSEKQEVANLLDKLCKKQKQQAFPQDGKPLKAPSEQGVYVIRKSRDVLHVGKTSSAKNGLNQRLKNHLYGSSSFTRKYLKDNGKELRKKGYTY